MTKSYETLVDALGLAVSALSKLSADTKELENAFALAVEQHEEEVEAVEALLREVDAHLDYSEDTDMSVAAEKVREIFD